MGKTVGLFRAIKPEWLNKIAELIIEGNDESTIKLAMGEYLSFEIGSEINRGKTRELLMNIWVRPEETSPLIRDMALEAFHSDRSDRVALHWALFVLAHPLFADAACLIGKISAVQGTFTTAWLKSKLCEMHGERPTLIRTVAGVLETMRFLGCIQQEKIGMYRVTRRTICDEHTIIVLLLSLLTRNTQAYYEFPELSRQPIFFPFEFGVPMEWLHRSPYFMFENFAGKTVLSRNNDSHYSETT